MDGKEKAQMNDMHVGGKEGYVDTVNKTDKFQKEQEHPASELKRLLGVAIYLEVNFTEGKFGVLKAISEENESGLIVAYLPEDFRIGKNESDRILREFKMNNKYTEPLTANDINNIFSDRYT